MTQEEKAKAYDEAIERAKKWRNAPNIDKMPTYGNRVIEEIFPELKESEDERIRKLLISLVKNWDKDGIAPKYTSNPNDIKQILAWLEKQSTPAKLSEEGLDVLETIDALEVKEVDLEKEFDNYAKDILACDVQFEPFTHLYNCAKHFYELGMAARNKAQKGK